MKETGHRIKAGGLLIISAVIFLFPPSPVFAGHDTESLKEVLASAAAGLMDVMEPPAKLHAVFAGTSQFQRYASAMLSFALQAHGYEVTLTAGLKQQFPDFTDPEAVSAEIAAETAPGHRLLLARVNIPDGATSVIDLCLFGKEPEDEVKHFSFRFAAPPALRNIDAVMPESIPANDVPWHSLFIELAGECRPAEKRYSDGWPLAEGRFFFENGYWSRAAERLADTSFETVSGCFLTGILAKKWSSTAGEASQTVNSMLKMHPDSGPLYAAKTWLALREGDTDDALMFLEQARLSDVAREGLYVFARYLVLLQDGMTEAAEEPLLTAVETLKDTAFVQLQAARYYWRQAKLEQSIRFYRQAIKAGAADAEVYIELGLALDAAGEAQKAIDTFMKAFTYRRGDLSVARHLSAMLRAAGRHEDALRVLAECVEANPESAGAAVALGDFSLYSWRIEQSIDAYKTALERDPDFGYARVALACAYLLKRDADRAITLLGSSLKNDRQDARALLMLGEALLHTGRVQEAIENLEAAARNSEFEHMARIALSNALLQNNEPERAIRQAQLAVSLKPDSLAFAMLARSFMEFGRLRDADNAMSKGLAANPRSPELLCASIELILFRTAEAADDEERNRLYEEAYKTAEKAIGVDSFHLDSYLLGGYSALGMRDFERCARMWAKASELDRWDPELAWQLARIYHDHLGAPEKAAPHFQRHIDLNGRYAGEAAEILDTE